MTQQLSDAGVAGTPGNHSEDTASKRDTLNQKVQHPNGGTVIDWAAWQQARPQRLLFTEDEMLNAPKPPVLVDNLLLAGTLASLVAEPGRYKTFVALDLALSIASGRPLFLGFPLHAKGPVVYVVGEGAGRFKLRLKAWKQHYGIDTPLGFHWTNGPINLLSKALAHPLQQWNERRVHRGAEALESAARMLNDAGRMAAAVPGRVLLPLLEAVSLEDDEHLRGMWVTLLANAADSIRGGDMLPAFVSILRDLSPVEALILEHVYLQHGDETRRIDYTSDNASARFNPATIKIFAGEGKEFVEVELPFRNYRVVADNLMRLGLVEQQFSGATYGSEASHRVYSELALTPLGHHLLHSCITLSM